MHIETDNSSCCYLIGVINFFPKRATIEKTLERPKNAQERTSLKNGEYQGKEKMICIIKVKERKNGKREFTGVFRAKKPKVLEPQYIQGNGWECKIKPSGTIICKTRDSKNKELRFIIYKNGFSKLVLKQGKKIKMIKQGYVINRKGELLDGFIGLTVGGKIEKKYAYFRSKNFQKFLSMHDISKIEKQDPNRSYITISAQEDEEGYFLDVITDGEIEKCNKDNAELWCDKKYSDYVRESYIIKNATWALVTEAKHNRKGKLKKHSVLYTLEKDFNNLKGIPLKEVNN